jgi:hypothetical protein
MIVLKRKMLRLFLAMPFQETDMEGVAVRDENRNTLMHHAFSMVGEEDRRADALQVCDKIVTQKRAFNEINKQGMTPLDLAIELRINDAVQYAL